MHLEDVEAYEMTDEEIEAERRRRRAPLEANREKRTMRRLMVPLVMATMVATTLPAAVSAQELTPEQCRQLAEGGQEQASFFKSMLAWVEPGKSLGWVAGIRSQDGYRRQYREEDQWILEWDDSMEVLSTAYPVWWEVVEAEKGLVTPLKRALEAYYEAIAEMWRCAGESPTG